MNYNATTGSRKGMVTLQRDDKTKVSNISPHEANAIVMYPQVMDRLSKIAIYLFEKMGDNNVMFGDELQTLVLDKFEDVISTGDGNLKKLQKITKV